MYISNSKFPQGHWEDPGAFDHLARPEHRENSTLLAPGPLGSPRPRLGVTSGHPARPELGSGSLRGHLARENSARSRFELEKLGSKSQELGKTRHFCLRGHRLAQNSARGHFGVTSGSLGSKKLGSRSLRGHLARENSARSQLEVEKT